jgi:hypothetical protein
MATVFNMAIDQGSDFVTNVQLGDDSGFARDITGYAVRGQLRRSFYSSTNVQFSCNISDAAVGEITIALSNAVTANLKYGRYVYDVELRDTYSGNVERILEGIATVYPEVTK